MNKKRVLLNLWKDKIFSLVITMMNREDIVLISELDQAQKCHMFSFPT